MIRPKSDINSKYLNLFLKLFYNSGEIIKYQAGSNNLRNLKFPDYLKIQIPLPPLSTQHLIVAKIEELFSELDKGIENLKLAQQQLKTYRQSVLKWAFEGKLTNANVKEGELPKGWEMVKTIDVIKIINNGYTPKSEFLFEGSGEIPFIKVYNLNFNGTLNFKKNPTFIPKANHEKDLKRSICLPGDVLINIVGPPLGKVSVVTNEFPEWNINQAIVMFRPNDDVLSKYISYYMQNSFTTNWLEGTSKATAGQWNVKVSTCREIPFPFCSIEEQIKVIQEIESRLSVADKMEESITQSLQQAEALRQSILKKAFEGKLIVEKKLEIKRPKNVYFHQLQVLGWITKTSKQKGISHGEMTIAKYTFLADKVYGVPTHYDFKRGHLGPYPIEMKKAINNKEYFKIDKTIEVVNEEMLFKYNNPFKDQVINAVEELAVIFGRYKGKERAHKTELLATVCKVIEDIKSTDLFLVYQSMREWPIDLKTTSCKNKAEKFTQKETQKCLAFIVERGWDKKLI